LTNSLRPLAGFAESNRRGEGKKAGRGRERGGREGDERYIFGWRRKYKGEGK